MPASIQLTALLDNFIQICDLDQHVLDELTDVEFSYPELSFEECVELTRDHFLTVEEMV